MNRPFLTHPSAAPAFTSPGRLRDEPPVPHLALSVSRPCPRLLRQLVPPEPPISARLLAAPVLTSHGRLPDEPPMPARPNRSCPRLTRQLPWQTAHPRPSTSCSCLRLLRTVCGRTATPGPIHLIILPRRTADTCLSADRPWPYLTPSACPANRRSLCGRESPRLAPSTSRSRPHLTRPLARRTASPCPSASRSCPRLLRTVSGRTASPSPHPPSAPVLTSHVRLPDEPPIPAPSSGRSRPRLPRSACLTDRLTRSAIRLPNELPIPGRLVFNMEGKGDGSAGLLAAPALTPHGRLPDEPPIPAPSASRSCDKVSPATKSLLFRAAFMCLTSARAPQIETAC